MKLLTTLQGFSPLSGCAVALGYFDGVHRGHRAVLDAALARKDLVPAVFTFSLSEGGLSPTGKQDGRLYPDGQRIRLLLDCGIRTVIIPPFAEIASMEKEEFAQLLCIQLGARAVFCGEDYRFSRGAAAGVDELVSLCGGYGVSVTALPPVWYAGERVSSTRVRALLRSGDVDLAGRLLGRPYTLDMLVETGQQLGRRLGFPTINQSFLPGMVMPRYGVYATRARIGDTVFPGVTSVGVRPTVGDHLSPRAETYLPGFSGDLYGCRISTEFLHYLRDEIRFESLDALKAQIAEDSRRVLSIAEPSPAEN